MAFAPLDVWARLLLCHRIGPRYALRVLFGLFTSAIGTAITLPERLILGPVLRFKARRNGTTLRHPPGAVVVLGYFRSGTTHLHYLLSCDPQFRTPRWCETLAPQGFFGSWAFLRVFMIPFVSAKRPQDDVAIGPEWPAEDDFALSNWGLASSLIGKFVVPRDHGRYDAFHSLEGLSERDRARWRFLQWAFCWKIARAARDRALLLKTPSHTARALDLAGILGPQTRFIHISRDPAAVVASNVAMAERLEIYNLQTPAEDEASLQARITRELLQTERLFLEAAASLPKGTLATLRYQDLVADPMGELRRVYTELNLDWTTAFEARALEYLHSVRDYRAATRAKPKGEGLTTASAELRDLAHRFGHDQPTAPKRELPELQRAASASSPRVFRAALLASMIAIACGLAWIIQSWFFHNRHDWLAWPVGVLIGLVAIRSAKVGSPRLGAVAALLTVLTFAAVSIPATFLSDYGHRPNYWIGPAGFLGEGRLIPVRDWEWYHILKSARVGSTAPNNVFWLFMGAVSAYRFASRKHVHPPGTR